MKKLTKCVNCGGKLVYSLQKNSVVCEHCDSVYAMSAPSRNTKLLRKYTIDFMPEADKYAQNQFVCNSCNSTHIVEEGKISTRCPSCGDTNISKSSAKTVSPDGIIPFELTKEKAVSIFERWLKKRKFAPNDLISLAKNGKLSNVYVPVYNINGVSVCAYSATVKKVHTDDSSGTIFSTMHTVQDVHADELENVVLCANNVVDHDLIEKVVTVNPSKIVPYSGEYMFGYTGADTNVSIHDSLDELARHLEDVEENKVRAKLKDKYDEIVHLSTNTKLRKLTFNYTFVPIFMNHYTYKGKKYHCYISGTTGKAEGKAPKSAGKILAMLGSIVLGVGILVLLIMKLI